MPSVDFLIQFRQSLTEEDCRVVISAIRQDPLIWECLKNTQFSQKVFAFAGNQAKHWNPGTLGILSIFPESFIGDLNSILAKPLEPKVQQRAILQFEQSLLCGQKSGNFEEAALVALALMERWRLRGSWQGIRDELLMKANDYSSAPFNLWSTPLACAYNLTPDPLDLLKALLPARNSNYISDLIGICIHPVLCSPLTVSEQVSIFINLFDHIPPDIQLQFLHQLEDWGRTELTCQLARTLLKTKCLGSYFYNLLEGSALYQSQSVMAPTSMDPLSHNESPQEVEKLQQLSAFYRFAGYLDRAGKPLALALEANRRLEARLLSHLALLSETNQNTEVSLQNWKKVVDLAPDSIIARTKLADSLIESRRYPEATDLIPASNLIPLSKITQVNAACGMGNLELVHSLGHDILNDASSFQPDFRLENNPLQIDWLPKPSDVVQMFNNADMAPEAVSYAKKVVDRRFGDRDLLELVTKSYLTAHLAVDGIETALIAVLANPNDLNLRRILAQMFEASQVYDKSFNERQFIIDHSNQPTTDDLLAYATIALKVEQPDITISVSKICLQSSPENGFAYALIGEALLLKQDLLGAIDYFTQATSFIPEQPGPWLALSKSLSQSGDHQKSLEVLRSAAQAVPRSSEILFALGERSLDSGYPSEGLSPLREAFIIDKKSPSIALRLGEVLFKLGYFDEANHILAVARASNPDQLELAYLHGQILLTLGEETPALHALLVGVKSTHPNVAACILLAQTVKSLIEDQKIVPEGLNEELPSGTMQIPSDELEAVITALNNVLQSEPANLEVNLLLAEIYVFANLNQEAFDTFVRLSEDPRSANLTWRSRIYLGLGKVSTRLGQVETAIASLQEASTTDPGNIKIQQALTEAFQAANLAADALQAAKSTLRLAPDNLQLITWFARTALTLNAIPEAIGELERALQNNPERTELILWLSHIQIQFGDLGSGRQYISQLLTLPNVKASEYRRAANLLYQIKDFPKAATCLEMAIRVNPNLSWELYYELAIIYEQIGKYSTALDTIQKAIAIQPDNLKLCVLQADLLARLDRNLAALACLEHSLQLPELKPDPESIQSFSISDDTINLSLASKFGHDITPARIHARFARLFRITGELHPALDHARQALELAPADIEIRALAVELAYCLLEDELALRLSNWNPLHEQFFNQELPFNPDQVPSVLSIFAFQADLNLASGNTDIAGQALARALTIAPNHPRLLALQSRLEIRNGDIEAANQLLSQSNANKTMRILSDQDGLLSFDKDTSNDLNSMWTQLSIAEATLELHQWQAALPLFQQAILLESQQPRPHFCFARALVIMAEKQEICRAVRIMSHAPGEEKLSDEFNKRFEEEIMLASHLCDHPEINHWKSRGQVVFQPCNETIKSLAKEPFRPDDIASLVAGHRKTGNLSEAKKATEISSDDPEVMFQLALTIQEESPQDSIGIIRKLIEKEPTNPVYIALLALLSQQEITEALKWIEIALGLWPDEVEWHKFAAELCSKIGDTVSSIIHWKKIVELTPDDLCHTLSLGQAYLNNHDQDLAIQVFEHAARQGPEQITTWKILAKAQLGAGNIFEASNSIERAISLNPEDRESVLISGQTALRLNQNGLATQRARAILANYPSDPDALLLYAQAMKQTGQPDEAMKLIDQALPILNNPLQLQIERAYLLKQTQGNQDTLPYLLDLIKIYPDNLELLSLLANTFSEVGQMDAAEQTAQTALELLPEDSTMHLLLGRIQRMKGQLDQSVYHLNEAIRQTPLRVDAYLELGRSHQERREHLQALKIYRQATEVAPDDYRPYYQAGLVLRESKDYIGAEAMFRSAAHLAPDDLNIRRQLGAIIILNLVHHTQEVTVDHE